MCATNPERIVFCGGSCRFLPLALEPVTAQEDDLWVKLKQAIGSICLDCYILPTFRLICSLLHGGSVGRMEMSAEHECNAAESNLSSQKKKNMPTS